MTTTDIDAIRQRAQAATPGPWTADRVDIKPDVFNPSRPNHRVLTPTGSLSAFCGEGAEGEANAEFIAHARTDVDDLLAKVDELTAELAANERSEDARLAIAEAEREKAHAERDRFHGMYANAQQALRNLADAYTDATGTPVCNCCFVDGSTQRCGRPATTIVDVPPFGFLDVAETCRSRINGEPAGEPERPAGVAR